MCVCGCLRGKRGFGEVQGGPVVITSDLLARSRASQKPLQMHPVCKPCAIKREVERERECLCGGRSCGVGPLCCHPCSRGVSMQALTLNIDAHFEDIFIIIIY